MDNGQRTIKPVGHSQTYHRRASSLRLHRQREGCKSSLEFAQARYYSTTHGRYTSVDPLTASASIRNPQTFNRYTYVLNSPYKYTDPLGLRPSDVKELTGSLSLSDRLLSGLSDNFKRDLWLMQVHIANGTAQGYAFLNALESSNRFQPTNAGLKLSEDGKTMLAAEGMEGTRDIPYDEDGDAGKNCTVGVGHFLASGACNGNNPDHTRKYSQQEINAFLSEDIEEAEYAVISKVYKVRLSQNEFDSLVMLAFNYSKFAKNGAPKLLAAINTGRVGGRNNYMWVDKGWGFIEEATIKKEWGNINYAGGKVVDGLTNRRQLELKLFFEGVYYK